MSTPTPNTVSTAAPASAAPLAPLRLTSFSHGGGCGCKIAPGVLSEILKNSGGGLIPPELMVGIETADDAAVYRLNDEQAPYPADTIIVSPPRMDTAS